MGCLRSFGLFAAWASLAVAQDLPRLGINIAPLYEDDSVTFLNMTLRMKDSRAKANTTLLYFEINKPQLSPSQRYDGDALTATDDEGVLPLSYTDVSGWKRNWVASRDPVGEIAFNFLAEPRWNVSGVAGRNDLRHDQGGAIGQGFDFIPYPNAQEDWEFVIDWDIPESAPAGTKFASSLGDVQGSSATGWPTKVLYSTYFAVGKLNRWPAWGEESTSGQEFAMYWIGDLPWDSTALASRTGEIYLGTAKYFSDSKSDYRVFYRRDFAAYGGAGGYKSFLMEYTEGSEIANPRESIENLISHEIIHAFAQMYPSTDYDKWYVEGVAEYLAAVAPYEGGALNKTTFVQWLNDNAQDYYTASPLTRTWDTLITNYWTQGTMVVKAPYTRGFMYLAYVQGLIATATNNKQSIDDIILELYHMYLDGKQVLSADFVTLLGNIIGADAAQASFDSMKNGTLLVPAAGSFASKGLKFVRKDLEQFASGAGMSENSYGSRKVISLQAGSRAEQAGLVEGDTIVSAWGLWGSTDTFESKMQVVISRDGQEKTVEWWPRTFNKVQAWEWVEAE
ncbi:Fc.00g023620.m01.CDS01 [Cosmosporella sp. VM-42]